MTTREASGHLGPYHLHRRLASDKGCTLYEAYEPEQGLRVALRVFPTILALPEQHRLAELASTPHVHPNIIAVRGIGEEGTHSFVATDFVDGESLVDYLARVGRLPAWQGLALVAQLLSALDFAHGRGWVHGAIEPRWLVVNRGGQLMLDGFGWAAAVDALSTRALEASPYTAPERVLGVRADHRSDLYSAAVVTYELLAGAPAFQVIDGFSSGRQVVRNAPRPARATRPELPANLEAVFQRALATRPEVRFRTAADLLAAMQAALGSPLWDRSEKAAAPKARSAAAVPFVQQAVEPAGAIVAAVAVEPLAPIDTADAGAAFTNLEPSPRSKSLRTEPVLLPQTPRTAAAASGTSMTALHANAAIATRPSKPRAQWLELAFAAGCLAAVGWIASMFVGASSPVMPGAADPAAPPMAAPAPAGSRPGTGPVNAPSVLPPPAVPTTLPAPAMTTVPPSPAEGPAAAGPFQGPPAFQAAPSGARQPIDVQATDEPAAPAPVRAPPRPAPLLDASPATAPAPAIASAPGPAPAAAPAGASNDRTTATATATAGASTPQRPAPQAVARRSPPPTPPRDSGVRVVRALSPNSPVQACRQEVAIAQEFCVVVRCATAEFRRHPVCVRMHAEQQRVRDLRAETMP